MSRKKFAKDAEHVVEEALDALKCLRPTSFVDKNKKIVLWNQIAPNKVGLVSGGGYRHTPFAVGFVGDGLLSCAVPGPAFAPSPPAVIFQAIYAVSQRNKNSGVLVLVMNYTEDIHNFGIAVEWARKHNINVEMLTIDEHHSQFDDDVRNVADRGMCGTCFIFKIAGCMARQGMNLTFIHDECRIINESMCTVGVTPASYVESAAEPLFKIRINKMDIDSNLQPNTGARGHQMSPFDRLIVVASTQITETLNLSPNDQICVIINSVGRSSQHELGTMCTKVYNYFTESNIIICRMYCGSLTTLINENSFKISVLNVSGHLEWLEYLDEPTDAPSWPAPCVSIPVPRTRNKQ